MEFEDLPQNIQSEFTQLYKRHIKICIDLLKEDRCVMPMLIVNREGNGNFVSLESECDVFDREKAFAAAKEFLRQQPFETAIFSYSDDGILKNSSALVTYVFDQSGACALYFTAYHYGGLFKRTPVYDKHILGNVTLNAF